MTMWESCLALKLFLCVSWNMVYSNHWRQYAEWVIVDCRLYVWGSRGTQYEKERPQAPQLTGVFHRCKTNCVCRIYQKFWQQDKNKCKQIYNNRERCFSCTTIILAYIFTAILKNDSLRVILESKGNLRVLSIHENPNNGVIMVSHVLVMDYC